MIVFNVREITMALTMSKYYFLLHVGVKDCPIKKAKYIGNFYFLIFVNVSEELVKKQIIIQYKYSNV